MELRRFRAIINETGLDDIGMSGMTFKVDQLVKDKIYTQADQSIYDERGRNSKPFFVDDNGCSRDIENAIKEGFVVEIFNEHIENQKMKGLLIHGDFCSGKSLFVRTLLTNCNIKAATIDCRGSDNIWNSTFHWHIKEKEKINFLIFDDISIEKNPLIFLPYTETIKVDDQFANSFYLNANIILVYANEIKDLPSNPSFLNRFEIINTNAISYKDLIDVLRNFNKEF